MKLLQKLLGKKFKKILGLVVVVLVIAAGGVLAFAFLTPDSEPEIITYSVLEKIVNTSNLSTYEAVYNGIAEVKNEKNPDKVDYYVSYEAKVKVGFDFSKIRYELNTQKKHLTVYIPEVSITSTNVDIGSMDFIFMNERANKETVSQAAYKACEQDVERESKTQNAIFELGQQNAKNYVQALVTPFVKQLDAAYTVDYVQEG